MNLHILSLILEEAKCERFLYLPSSLCPLLLPPLIYPDASLTPQNIFQSTSAEDYNDLRGCLVVPAAVYYQINANSSYPTEEKRREAMIVYYLNTIPLASWARLAGQVYWQEKHVSLEAVRKYLHHTTG